MSNSTAGQQPLTQQLRDQLFSSIRGINQNNICFDCAKKNPKWSSIHLGIHLCIDCAGKHRQYGVQYSFVKSINLDKWNRKQVLYMQKGGNQRAFDYFKKCGMITQANKHVDYKSGIAQKYKSILTAEVQAQLTGNVAQNTTTAQKKIDKDFFQQQQQVKQAPKKIQNISNNVQEVKTQQNAKQSKKKKKQKAIGQRINLQLFDNIQFDDGVPTEQKQKAKKQNQTFAKSDDFSNDNKNPQIPSSNAEKVHIEEPKELSQEQVKQRMEQLKANQNLKSISSDQFKDSSAANNAMKQNLNKFSGSQSISSSAFFGEQEDNKGDFKEKMSAVYNKFTGLWNK